MFGGVNHIDGSTPLSGLGSIGAVAPENSGPVGAPVAAFNGEWQPPQSATDRTRYSPRAGVISCGGDSFGGCPSSFGLAAATNVLITFPNVVHSFCGVSWRT